MKKIKELFSYGEYDIPISVAENAIKFYKIGLVIAGAGGILNLILANIWGIIISIVVGIGVGLIGYLRILSISRTGYKEIVGVCEAYEKPIIDISIKKKKGPTIKSFLVKSRDDKIYRIPYYKENHLIDEGSEVIIYVREDEREFVGSDGYINFNTILGYEAVGKAKDYDYE